MSAVLRPTYVTPFIHYFLERTIVLNKNLDKGFAKSHRVEIMIMYTSWPSYEFNTL